MQFKLVSHNLTKTYPLCLVVQAFSFSTVRHLSISSWTLLERGKSSISGQKQLCRSQQAVSNGDQHVLCRTSSLENKVNLIVRIKDSTWASKALDQYFTTWAENS